jgi:hypothetical protein
MRKAIYRALPILAAGAFAAVVAPAPEAGAIVPFPTTYPWCELDVYCYDDDIALVTDPQGNRDETQYGGGFLIPNDGN